MGRRGFLASVEPVETITPAPIVPRSQTHSTASAEIPIRADTNVVSRIRDEVFRWLRRRSGG